MSRTIRKILLILALVCFALVSCDGPDSCDLQMVAGGSQICQDARK